MYQLYKNLFFFLSLSFVLTQSIAAQKPMRPDYPPGALFNKLSAPKRVLFRNDTIMVRPRWFIPDHYKVQYAGVIGFLSLGAGYNVRDKFEPTLFIGYLNETFGNSSVSVTTVSLKNSFNLCHTLLPENLWIKAGVSINWGHTNNTFDKLPPHYAEKYYFQNKVHFSPFLGGEWTIKLRDKNLKAAGLYFEFNTLDAYLLECFRTEYVKLGDIWNLAIGITVYIH